MTPLSEIQKTSIVKRIGFVELELKDLGEYENLSFEIYSRDREYPRSSIPRSKMGYDQRLSFNREGQCEVLHDYCDKTYQQYLTILMIRSSGPCDSRRPAELDMEEIAYALIH
jgi:hypothetical protein